MHVCAKFQGNRTRNTPTVAKTNFDDVTTSWRRDVIKISTPSRHAPYPPLYPVQVSWRSVEASRSLNVCKKVVVVVVVVGGSSNGLPRNGHFRPLLALWGRGVESPGKFFWLNPITLVPATLPNHKIAEIPPRMDANPECCHQVIVPWLRLVLAIGGFKGRTSLARLVM